MKKLLLVSLCFLMLCVTQVFAQNRTVTGTVVAKEDGLPIPGVTVSVRGTAIGTQTNTAGKYTLSVPAGATLVFRFIGYAQIELPANNAVVNATLTLSTKELGEVVVTTSLGIKKQAREVGYATTTVSSASVNETNPTNSLSGLTAKVAGLVVSNTDNGINSSFRVTLRGNRSVAGNNQALVVVDGSPVPNNVLSSINPEDIESYDVLNGSGAAALYGSEASNGALIITTKRGNTQKPTIQYSNAFQVAQAAYFPKFQNQFGQYGGEPAPYIDPVTGASLYVPYENQQYGPAFNGSNVVVGYPAGSATGPVLTVPYTAQKVDPRIAFFNKGYTEQNNLSFRQGDAKNSVYFSAQNVYQTGVVPEDKSTRTSVRLGVVKTYGMFNANATASYAKTNISTFSSGYDGSNLFTDLIQFPANLNIKQFKDANNGTFSNPSDFYDAYAINPYQVVEDNRSNIARDVFLGNLKLTLSPTKWLDASYTVAESSGTYQLKTEKQAETFTAYALSDPYGAGSVQASYPNGVKAQVQDILAYGDGSGSAVNYGGTNPNYAGNQGYSRLQGDALLNFHHTFFNDFKTSLLLGNTVWEENLRYIADGSTQLSIPGFYNVNTIGGVPNVYEAESTIRQIAYFGDASISYKNFATVEGTLRKDEDSRLPVKNQKFYYPSIKFVFIPTDAIPELKANNILNYMKLYLDLSRVGQVSSPPYPYNTYSFSSGFPYGTLGGLSVGGTNYSSNLRPEIISEVEFGGEVGLLNDRIDIKADYYNQKSRNQTLQINTSPATGYTNSLINAGEIQSSGEEITLTGIILPKGKNSIGWTVGGNLSINDSKVVSLLPGVNSFNVGSGIYAIVGQPYPVYQGTDFQRDPSGHVIVDPTTGYPINNPNLHNFGRTTPKYTMGLNTAVSYKFVTLSVVAEYRGGDVIYNGIGSTLNFGGTSYQSASAGRQRFVFPNSVIQTGTNTYVTNTNISVQNGNYGFWQQSAFNTTNTPYVTSGAFWSLREVALNFNLTQFITPTKFIKGLSVGLNGRNLFLWKPKENTFADPEFNQDSGNDIGVNSVNNFYGVKYYGGNLSITF